MNLNIISKETIFFLLSNFFIFFHLYELSYDFLNFSFSHFFSIQFPTIRVIYEGIKIIYISMATLFVIVKVFLFLVRCYQKKKRKVIQIRQIYYLSYNKLDRK